MELVSDLVHLQGIRNALEKREELRQMWRNRVAVQTKLPFMRLLSGRGYFGDVHFNHTEGTLSLMVSLLYCG